jgi:hypothetical protein
MSAQIRLYKDVQLTIPLTDGTWVDAVDLGTSTIPTSGSSPQTAICVYAKNTGTTTIRDIYIRPIAGGGSAGSQLAADIQIAQDIAGATGSFGAVGTQQLVLSGNCGFAKGVPGSNTTTNVSNPGTPPTLSAGVLSSNLPAGVYTVAYSFTNVNGETLISPTANFTITAQQSVRVASIALATNATGINYYISYRASDSSSLFFSNNNVGGTSIDLLGARGFFRFWTRQTIDSADTPGIRQAKLQLDGTDIG